ncbi:glycogen synthase [Desulfatitalea alkaliphila]|uniref:Glycogen synthase n=1 Tax=Desulfatitalea alkaliphila TaxID=2929485 RepID=A0AA41R302_9BACT|nr:glycogen synthase [Desulfatitalea alkaliphila]MCJ8501964.1 glycogen synthase [Desulfatitalea alkaliphila]
MKILFLSNEYPPHIYGGAGVHVQHLGDALLAADNGAHRLEVLCFGDQDVDRERLRVSGIGGREWPGLQRGRILDPLYRNLVMSGMATAADVVHCHTWYSYLAGCLLKQMLRIPLLVTTHSLEPHRPWKQEQLGEGYYASMWLERTAMENADGIIAVSKAMSEDVQTLYGVAPDRVRVIYNGIDTDRYRPTENPAVLTAYGVDPQRPYVLFVGRLTHQKGILHLVKALPHLQPGTQVVLCAGAPDTEAIAREMRDQVAAARETHDGPIVWVSDMVPEKDLVVLYSQAALFVCPSVYEPFGIINLEAMACHTPVVAAAVGGIPEVVRHGETGLLVPFAPAGPEDPEPLDPEAYARDLAAAINELLAAPEKRRLMGIAARRRVEAHFSWQRIAAQTLQFYRDLV